MAYSPTTPLTASVVSQDFSLSVMEAHAALWSSSGSTSGCPLLAGKRRRAHIMGGGLLKMLTLANAVSPSLADMIGLRRFAKLIQQHRPR
jgi:hypothetical protein